MENMSITGDYPENIEHKVLFQSKLIEAVNDSIIVAGIDGKIIYWNKGSEHLLGWSAKEMIGQPFFILFEENLLDIPTNINEIHKGYWSSKVPIYTKKGIKKYVNLSVSAMDNHQNIPTYLVGIISDITELMEFRIEAEEALRSKEEFIANISHEIRTPMAGILGYAELLDGLLEDNMQKDYLNSIKDSANQLLNLINDILDLSKINADKILISDHSFNLVNLVNSVAKIYTPAINAKNLDFFIDIAPELPAEIISDSVRIKQILSNLLSNAIKFTHHGQISISIRKGNLLNNKLELILEVTDTGIGIPAHKLPVIYEPFMQTDSSTTRKYGGTGLGLFITKKLVDILNGQIKIETEENAGSKFLLSIPVTIAAPATSSPTHSDSNLEHNNKLLFISENEDQFVFLSESLADTDIKSIWVVDSTRLSSTISFYEPEILVIDNLNSTQAINLLLEEIANSGLSHTLYILSQQAISTEIKNENTSSIKLVNSLDCLMTELQSTAFTKFYKPFDNLINILLIDEDQINSLLIKKILESSGYIINVISDLTELPLLEEVFFHIVLLEGDFFKKYNEKVFTELQLISYSTLIGIINVDDNINNVLFTDYLYKPVTTNNLLKIINKYAGGI